MLGRFIFCLERFGGHFPVGFFQQDFHPAFRFFELLLAFARKLYSFFEESHRLIEREVGTLEPLHHFFEASEGFFEVAFAKSFGCFVRGGIHAFTSRSLLAAGAEIRGAAALLVPADWLPAPAAFFSFTVVRIQDALKTLEPPIRVAKIGRGGGGSILAHDGEREQWHCAGGALRRRKFDARGGAD